MNNERVIRIHKVWLLTEIIKIIRNCVIVYFFLLFLKQWIPINNITVYILILIIAVYSIVSLFLYWRNFEIFLLESKIKIKKGSFIKNIVHLNHDKIAGIDQQNNILEKLFCLNSIIIKVNSTDKDESITIPTLKEKDSKSIKESLNLSVSKNEEFIGDVYFKTDTKDIFKNALSSFNLIIFCIFLYSIYSTISDYINIDWLIIIIKSYSLNNIYSIIISIIIIFIATYIYTLVKSLLKYKNFTLINNSKNLVINYGTISRVKRTILKDSISAIIIKSSAIQNLLKFEEVKVISMNPQKDNTEEEIILPISKKENGVKHIHNILNLDVKKDTYEKMKKSIFILKCYRKTRIFFLFIPILIILNNNYLNILIGFLYLYSLIYQFCYVAFTYYSLSGNTFNFKKKSLNIEQIIIPYKDMEEIIIKQSLIQRIFKVGTIVIINKAVPPKIFKFSDIPIRSILKIQNIFINKNN